MGRSKFSTPKIVTDNCTTPPGDSTRPLLGKNRRLVTDEPVEFEDNRLKFETAGGLPIILEKSIEGASEILY